MQAFFKEIGDMVDADMLFSPKYYFRTISQNHKKIIKKLLFVSSSLSKCKAGGGGRKNSYCCL
jgi:hypothetical protein